MCLTIHATPHLYILDIIDSVDSRQCAHSPFHSSQEKCVARWTQIHGKQNTQPTTQPRIWNKRGARRNERETHCWLTLERVRNSLLESFQSRRLSLVAGRDAKVTNWTDPLTLNPWLWRANRLNHNGRSSATFASASECPDESVCCT